MPKNPQIDDQLSSFSTVTDLDTLDSTDQPSSSPSTLQIKFLIPNPSLRFIQGFLENLAAANLRMGYETTFDASYLVPICQTPINPSVKIDLLNPVQPAEAQSRLYLSDLVRILYNITFDLEGNEPEFWANISDLHGQLNQPLTNEVENYVRQKIKAEDIFKEASRLLPLVQQKIEAEIAQQKEAEAQTAAAEPSQAAAEKAAPDLTAAAAALTAKKKVETMPAEQPSAETISSHPLISEFLDPRLLTSSYAELIVNTTIQYLNAELSFKDLDPEIQVLLRERSFNVVNSLIWALKKDELLLLATDPLARYRLIEQSQQLLLERIIGNRTLLSSLTVTRKDRDETAYRQYLTQLSQDPQIKQFFTQIADTNGYHEQEANALFVKQLTEILGPSDPNNQQIANILAVALETYAFLPLSQHDFLSLIESLDSPDKIGLFNVIFNLNLSPEQFAQVRKAFNILKDKFLLSRANLIKINSTFAAAEIRVPQDQQQLQQFKQQVTAPYEFLQPYAQAGQLTALAQELGTTHGDYQDQNNQKATAFIETWWGQLSKEQKLLYYQLFKPHEELPSDLTKADANANYFDLLTAANTPDLSGFERLSTQEYLNSEASNFSTAPGQALQGAKNFINNAGDQAGKFLAGQGIPLALNALAPGAGVLYNKAKALPIVGKILDKVEEKTGNTLMRMIKIGAAGATYALVSTLQALSSIGGLLGGAIGSLGFIAGPAGFITVPLFANLGASIPILGSIKWTNLLSKPQTYSAIGKVASATGKGASAASSTFTSAAGPGAGGAGMGAGAMPPGWGGPMGFLSGFFGNYAVASTTIALGLTSVFSYLTLTSVFSAFLIDIPTEPLGTFQPSAFGWRESKYVKIEKKATINSQAACPGNICKNPQFPLSVNYQIVITPKDDYQITIKNITDERTVDHNIEKYQKMNQEVPYVSQETKTINDFSEIKVDQVIKTGESITLQYSDELNQDFNHANVNNIFTLEFSYQNQSSSGEDKAITGEVLALGEPPGGCWPASGLISQLPFNAGFSHGTSDAIDIAAVTGTKIYAPFTGTLCPFTRSTESVFGYSKSLQISYQGQTRYLLFAHMTPSSITANETCHTVTKGEVIGFVGNTGYSTGPHLHYEISKTQNFGGTIGSLATSEILEILPNGQSVTLDQPVISQCQ